MRDYVRHELHEFSRMPCLPPIIIRAKAYFSGHHEPQPEGWG